MLTSFFGNSRPVNFLILSIIIFLAYLWGSLSGNNLFFSPLDLLAHAGYILLAIISMLLLDFIVKRNKLTQSNSFAAFFYTFFMGMLPLVFLSHDILLANFFLLLALRRIMSLRNDTNSKKKILDASIWITVASLFYFYSILLLLPLWIAIIKKPNPDYKQMLVPFTGFVAVVIINTAVNLLTAGTFQWLLEWQQPVSLDFSSYNSAVVFIPVSVILAFLVWTGFYRVHKISTMPLKSRPNYRLLLYICLTYILISIAGPAKTGAEVLFIIAPVAILSANYMETSEGHRMAGRDKVEMWFKELLLWLVVLLSAVFIIL